ncbi:MAG: hypothetical protein JXR07_18300 [Reichenbachiella sp.]
MKKIHFSKGDAVVNSGFSSKLKVAALALGLSTTVGLGACVIEDECTSDSDVTRSTTTDTGSNLDLGTNADPNVISTADAPGSNCDGDQI